MAKSILVLCTTEPRASCMVSTCSTIDLYQPQSTLFHIQVIHPLQSRSDFIFKLKLMHILWGCEIILMHHGQKNKNQEMENVTVISYTKVKYYSSYIQMIDIYIYHINIYIYHILKCDHVCV
jgi:hypothetical protein